MKIKRFFAPDMRHAIRKIREELGPDAVILSNRQVDGGIEIVSAVEYDDDLLGSMLPGNQNAAASQVDHATVKNFSFEHVNNHGQPLEPAPVEQEPQAASAPLQENAAARYGMQQASARKVQTEHVSDKPRQHADDATITELRNELKTLRSVLEQQLTHLHQGTRLQAKPQLAMLWQQLQALDVSPDLAERLIDKVQNCEDSEQAWHHALAHLAHAIQITDDDILNRGGVVALVGPTGVGKTTSIAKLAARFALRHGANQVAMISTDHYRIGGHEQLLTFGRLMGVPTFVAANRQELLEKLIDLSDRRLVLIDTAGMSQRDMRLSEELTALQDAELNLQAYLVLAANTERQTLHDVVRAFKRIPLSGCILTKVDEANRLGGVLSAVVAHDLAVAYVSDGQRVPEDMHPARPHGLVSRAVSNAQQEMPSATGQNLGKMANAHV